MGDRAGITGRRIFPGRDFAGEVIGERFLHRCHCKFDILVGHLCIQNGGTIAGESPSKRVGRARRQHQGRRRRQNQPDLPHDAPPFLAASSRNGGSVTSRGAITFDRCTITSRGPITFDHCTITSHGAVAFDHSTITGHGTITFDHSTITGHCAITIDCSTITGHGSVALDHSTVTSHGSIAFDHGSVTCVDHAVVERCLNCLGQSGLKIRDRDDSVAVNVQIYGGPVSRSIVFDKTTIDKTTIDNATIDNATIDNATIDNATIDNATIDNATIDNATINGAAINGAANDWNCRLNLYIPGKIGLHGPDGCGIPQRFRELHKRADSLPVILESVIDDGFLAPSAGNQGPGFSIAQREVHDAKIAFRKSLTRLSSCAAQSLQDFLVAAFRFGQLSTALAAGRLANGLTLLTLLVLAFTLAVAIIAAAASNVSIAAAAPQVSFWFFSLFGLFGFFLLFGLFLLFLLFLLFGLFGLFGLFLWRPALGQRIVQDQTHARTIKDRGNWCERQREPKCSRNRQGREYSNHGLPQIRRTG